MDTYSSRIRAAGMLAVLAAGAAGFVGGQLTRLGAPGEHFWLLYPVLLVLWGLALAAGLPWWRKLDDMQRAGHLAAWYWGGQAGMLAVLMALIAGTGTHSDLTRGSLFTLLGIAAGYLAFFAAWRLRQRGPEE